MALYAAHDPSHAKAVRAAGALQGGKHGKVFVTDFVIAETLNFFVAKSRDPGFPDRLASELLGEGRTPWMQLIRVDGATWAAARERFRAYSKDGLSFTDCTSIAAAERLGLSAIVSYDSGFDGIITRLT